MGKRTLIKDILLVVTYPLRSFTYYRLKEMVEKFPKEMVNKLTTTKNAEGRPLYLSISSPPCNFVPLTCLSLAVSPIRR